MACMTNRLRIKLIPVGTTRETSKANVEAMEGSKMCIITRILTRSISYSS